MQSARYKAILALVIANILWGGASPFFKWSLTNIEPFTLAFLRFAIAALMFFPFVRKEILKIKLEDIPNIILFGFFGITINITFFFFGLKLSPAINSALIATIQPFILLVMGWIFLKENVQKIEVFGTFVSFVGVIVITLYPIITDGIMEKSTISGNILFIISALGAVAAAFWGKKLFKKYEPAPITFWSFVVGAASFLPVFVWEAIDNPLWITKLQTPGFFGIIYGAIFSSLIAYSLYDWSLSKIEASETGIFTYLIPITSIIIAVPFFGEKITFPYITGAVLVMLGILLTERRLPYHPLHKELSV